MCLEKDQRNGLVLASNFQKILFSRKGFFLKKFSNSQVNFPKVLSCKSFVGEPIDFDFPLFYGKISERIYLIDPARKKRKKVFSGLHFFLFLYFLKFY